MARYAGRAVLLCGLFGVACGTAHTIQEDADAAIRGGVTKVSEDAYVSKQVAATVALTTRCCQRIGLTGVNEAYGSSVKRGLLAQLPASGSGSRYDSQAAADCLDAYAKAPCTLLKDERTPLPGCAQVYTRGHRQIGESCRSYFDCAQDSGADTRCFQLKCVKHKVAGEGELCTNTDPNVAIDCAGTLLCDDQTGMCVRRAARDAACLTGAVWGDTCEMGSVCDRRGSMLCVEPLGVGTPCNDDSLCEGGACYRGRCRTPLFETSGGDCK